MTDNTPEGDIVLKESPTAKGETNRYELTIMESAVSIPKSTTPKYKELYTHFEMEFIERGPNPTDTVRGSIEYPVRQMVFRTDSILNSIRLIDELSHYKPLEDLNQGFSAVETERAEYAIALVKMIIGTTGYVNEDKLDIIFESAEATGEQQITDWMRGAPMTTPIGLSEIAELSSGIHEVDMNDEKFTSIESGATVNSSKQNVSNDPDIPGKTGRTKHEHQRNGGTVDHEDLPETSSNNTEEGTELTTAEELVENDHLDPEIPDGASDDQKQLAAWMAMQEDIQGTDENSPPPIQAEITDIRFKPDRGSDPKKGGKEVWVEFRLPKYENVDSMAISKFMKAPTFNDDETTSQLGALMKDCGLNGDQVLSLQGQKVDVVITEEGGLDIPIELYESEQEKEEKQRLKIERDDSLRRAKVGAGVTAGQAGAMGVSIALLGIPEIAMMVSSIVGFIGCAATIREWKKSKTAGKELDKAASN